MTQETLPERVELRLWPFFVRTLEQASRLRPGIRAANNPRMITSSWHWNQTVHITLKAALIYMCGVLLGLLTGYLVIGIIYP